MTSGGARVRSGPAPDPNALRRDRDFTAWRHLPSTGRSGDPPPWPLTRQTVRERALWADLWARPQAIVWEENGQVHEVALLVRAIREGERPGAAVAARTLVMRLMDSLGLTLPGLRAQRWIIGAAPVITAAPTVGRRADSSIRKRLEVLDGGA